ncbi:putative pre-rna splicing factor srp2 [Phaeomoniella chlamydospora]|uniref:Putative pre-rna splicing factor srp2 n=1 Tax=Phaeomoniella chlamydospora TaxID=158046 RepID=A0A0G2G1A3_PHACM|nr:putative pre-rna splicing factor srp2 [Phaeomoniella chlamydospora]
MTVVDYATKQEVEDHFNTHGTGKITEIKLMNGFGFIEYEDHLDARDVVPACHGTNFKNERLTVQFARGPRQRESGFSGAPERNVPRPRRTIHRMQITGLPVDTSWQDLKDFARQSQLDVVYSETGRDRDGRGFVEFETADDLRSAVEKLDGKEFKGAVVHCVADTQASIERAPRDPYRSRSPLRGRYGPPADDYDRRPPPRGYTPPGRYRERSPLGRRPYYDDPYLRRSPGRGRLDDYPPPPPRRYDDSYGDPRGPPPPRAYGDPYVNGRDYPPRPRSPPRGGYGPDYDRRPYY